MHAVRPPAGYAVCRRLMRGVRQRYHAMNESASFGFFGRRPLVIWATAWYLILVVMAFAPITRDFGLFFIWPFPFIMCSQKWIGGSIESLMLAGFLGLCAVIGVGFLTQKMFHPGRPVIAIAVIISPIICVLSLVLITVFSCVISEGLGWPTGE